MASDSPAWRAAQTDKAGGVPKHVGSPPASTELGYQACISGLRGVASAILRCFGMQAPPQRAVAPSALRNYAGPQHFCHYRGCDDAWVPGTVLGRPVREVGPSLPDRSWPHRASVSPLYSVTPVTSRGNCHENAEAMPARDVGCLLERRRRRATATTGAAANRSVLRRPVR